MQVLQTDRLILRRFVESDAEAMFQNWASSAENLTYVTWDPHSDVEVTRNSIRNWVASIQIPTITNGPFVSKKTRAGDRRYQHRCNR